jgi:hypothetical protein
MDVRLPNGTIIKNVPEGTSKEAVMQKAISAGLAKPEDFGQQASPAVDESGMPQLSMNENPATTGAPPKPETGFIEDVVGLAETIGTLGTGATLGVAGGIIGAGEGLASSVRQGKFGTQEGADIVEQTMADYMQRGTYAPRTQAGQEIAVAAGEAAALLPPTLAAFSPAQVAGAGQAARASMQAARPVAAEAAHWPISPIAHRTTVHPRLYRLLQSVTA